MASRTRWTWVCVNSGRWWWQGGLACCDSWGRKESDTTERLNWTEGSGILTNSGQWKRGPRMSLHSGVLGPPPSSRLRQHSRGVEASITSLWASNPKVLLSLIGSFKTYLGFWSFHTVCGMLVLWLGIKPAPTAWKQRLNHWTTTDVTTLMFLTKISWSLFCDLCQSPGEDKIPKSF